MSIWDSPLNLPNPETKLDSEGLHPKAYFMAEDPNTAYYQMIVLDIKENHSEGVGIVSSLADSNFTLTMGANPVNVAISGLLITTRDNNQRDSFSDTYDKELRGTKGKIIHFICKDVVMRLKVSSINLSTSREMDDMTRVSIEGSGFKYNNYTLPEITSE